MDRNKGLKKINYELGRMPVTKWDEELSPKEYKEIFSGIVQEKYEHTTLDTLIEQDVEHGTFRAQNCFDDEYLTPMFYKYAKGLEKEVEFLRAELNAVKEELDKQIAANEAQESVNGQSKS